jgi:hypothetical protein
VTRDTPRISSTGLSSQSRKLSAIHDLPAGRHSPPWRGDGPGTTARRTSGCCGHGDPIPALFPSSHANIAASSIFEKANTALMEALVTGAPAHRPTAATARGKPWGVSAAGADPVSRCMTTAIRKAKEKPIVPRHGTPLRTMTTVATPNAWALLRWVKPRQVTDGLSCRWIRDYFSLIAF